MNTILQKITEGASDAASLAKSVADSGLRSVNEVFQGVKIFGALSATSTEHVDYDETHYVLLPLLNKEQGYAIYTKRILPPDIGVTNSLPKARIFHVPDETGKELLEQELVAGIVRSKQDGSEGTSDIADILEQVAELIDRETNKISGGLVLVGGVAAIVNPLLGVSIIAKGLLPSMSAKASKVGAEYIGSKLRDRSKSVTASKLQRNASSEVKKLEPKVYANPIIRSLEAIASNPATEFDPAFDHRNWVDEFELTHYYGVTVEAIREIYQESENSLDLSIYQEVHCNWIKSFFEA